MFFLIFITKNTNANEILFFNFFLYLQLWLEILSSYLEKCLLTFVILAGLQSTGFKYLNKHRLTLFWSSDSVIEGVGVK